MAYSRPYIMDLSEVELKLAGNHTLFPDGPIPTPKLKEIIREFVRLEAHCDDAKGLCEHNVGQIINGGDILPYPPITVPQK